MISLPCSYGAARSMDLAPYYGDVRTAAVGHDAVPALNWPAEY